MAASAGRELERVMKRQGIDVVAEPPLAQGTETVWNLRQELTGGLTETIVAHAHRGESTCQQTRCPQCDRCLKARAPVSRTVEMLVGAVQME